MEEIINQHQTVAIWVMGGLVGLLLSAISGLMYGILFFVKKSFDNLTNAIRSLERRFENGVIDIGHLKDRMATQEAICSMQRKICPGLVNTLIQDRTNCMAPGTDQER